MVRIPGLLRGFTLIELLVTLTVAGVLAAIALPSLSTVIKNGRLATETNDLMGDLAFARAEASRRGQRVTVCVSQDGVSCGSGSVWTGGRIVFADAGTYGVVGAGDEVLRVGQAATSGNVTIVSSGFSVLNYVQYRQNGSINSTSTGSFKICDDRVGSFGRSIELLSTGRASLTSTKASCP